MKKSNIYMIAALLGTVLAGCQKEQAIERPEEPTIEQKTVALTIQVSKESEDTKALDLDGKKLKASWAAGEKVDVYLREERLGTLEVQDTPTPGATATLSGRIKKTGDLEKVPCTLTLLFPGREDHAWTYLDQDGSFLTGSLAESYDYTLATLNVTAVTDEAVTASVSSNFATQQSVYRFGFKVGGAGDAIAVKSFTVSSSQSKLVRTRTNDGGTWTSAYGSIPVTTGTAPDGNLYCVALRNENTTVDDVYTFTVVGSNDALYEGTQAVGSANLGPGRFLGAKGISISQKAMAPAATGTISSVNAVL